MIILMIVAVGGILLMGLVTINEKLNAILEALTHDIFHGDQTAE